MADHEGSAVQPAFLFLASKPFCDDRQSHMLRIFQAPLPEPCRKMQRNDAASLNDEQEHRPEAAATSYRHGVYGDHDLQVAIAASDDGRECTRVVDGLERKTGLVLVLGIGLCLFASCGETRKHRSKRVSTLFSPTTIDSSMEQYRRNGMITHHAVRFGLHIHHHLTTVLLLTIITTNRL